MHGDESQTGKAEFSPHLQHLVNNSGQGARLTHLLITQQFTRALLTCLFELAEKARRLHSSRVGAEHLKQCLPNRRALLYFVQPSTRTRLSFQAAGNILGMTTAEVTSTRTSSEHKGESPLDSVHTFGIYHDVIVIRYPEAGFAEECSRLFMEQGLKKCLINAGSGMEQHPTQALLDVYTLHRECTRLGGIDGKHIMIVGDLRRGRAVRSLIYLLGKYEGIKLTLVSPRELSVADDMKQYMVRQEMEFSETDDIQRRLGEVDAIYMTRAQDEYEAEVPAPNVDYAKFALDPNCLGRIRPTCAILHPLPRRAEIHPSIDRDPRARYWAQVENGMWVRVALLAYMLDGALHIQTA